MAAGPACQRGSGGELMPRAFEGLRVLDLSDRLSGAYCARLFGDFGADVLLLELPEGHALRKEPPFLDDSLGPDRSLVHAYVNANKRSRTTAGNVEDLADHIADSDIIVTTEVPLRPALDEALKAKRADAVQVSVTPFGLEGPLAGMPGNNLTHSAMSGWADICGYEAEPPLQLPPHQSDYFAGAMAFVGAAAAILRSHDSGDGALVDTSELEATVVSSVPWALAAVTEGSQGLTALVHMHSREKPEFYQTLDGEIMAGFGQGQFWMDAMRILGIDELVDDRFADPLQRLDHLEEIRSLVQKRIDTQPSRELFEKLATIRSVVGMVQTTEDLLQDPHLDSRDYFVETEMAGRPLQMPGASAKLSATPWKLRSPAPNRSEPQPEAPLPRKRPAPTAGVRTDTPVPVAAPLAGMRVLTFTQAWTGPLATELLALLGADVVQIEARSRPDVWRTYSGGYRAAVPEPIVDPSRTQRAWNVVGLYNATNLNKRAITLDMSDPHGEELFWNLVPKFDVFAENFSPHVLPNWRITYEKLRERRPDVIVASLSGYGATGPYSPYAANGATIEPMSGFSSVNGHDGGPSQNTGGLIPDPVGGVHLAVAILAAAHHRSRTGVGQQIDVSMVEAMTAHLGDAVLEWSANGNIRKPLGNRHARIAPHGVYPTRDKEWLALAAENDEAWTGLAELLELNPDARNNRFGSAESRKLHEDELDTIVAKWCADQEVDLAAAALRAIGCSAARVATIASVLERPDPQLLSRSFMAEIEHPEAGVSTVAVAPWQFSGEAVELVRPSPCMGEHSFEVLRDELGVTRAEYDELVEAGVTGDMPPA